MGSLGQARADSRGQLYTYALTAGYEANLTPEWRLTPSLALRSTHLRQDDIHESAPNALAFDVAQFNANRTDIALRLDSDYRVSIDEWQITPRLFAEYRRNLGDKDSQADIMANGVPVTPIAHVRGDNLLRGGAELDVSYGRWTMALRGDGTTGDKSSGGNVAITLGARF
ncbi:autotransporter outer membrane beta-barrel domain-containing protein [Edwardsiella ictaluri]